MHSNDSSNILNTFMARAVCNHDAEVIAAVLRKDVDYFWVEVQDCVLSFSSYCDSQDAFRDLCLAVRDNFPDAHRLVGTFAVDDAFTGEVFDMNYFNYDVLCGKVL